MGEGPCLDAWATGRPVLADSPAAVARWPRFAPRAASAGYRSVHAVPLRLRDEAIGAMGLFGTDQGRMDPDDLRIVQGLADVVTTGLLQQRAVRRGDELSEHLQGALDSRVVVAVDPARPRTRQRTTGATTDGHAMRRTTTLLPRIHRAAPQVVVDLAGEVDVSCAPRPRPWPGSWS